MAALGVLSFVIGRLLPKSWFHADRFPYKTAAYEPKIYQALRVKSWQGKVPDMSRIFKKIMPEKKMTAETIADVPRMLEETCVGAYAFSPEPSRPRHALDLAGRGRDNRHGDIYSSGQPALHNHSEIQPPKAAAALRHAAAQT